MRCPSLESTQKNRALNATTTNRSLGDHAMSETTIDVRPCSSVGNTSAVEIILIGRMRCPMP
jgi:hypothetical protein